MQLNLFNCLDKCLNDTLICAAHTHTQTTRPFIVFAMARKSMQRFLASFVPCLMQLINIKPCLGRRQAAQPNHMLIVFVGQPLTLPHKNTNPHTHAHTQRLLDACSHILRAWQLALSHLHNFICNRCGGQLPTVVAAPSSSLPIPHIPPSLHTPLCLPYFHGNATNYRALHVFINNIIFSC